MPLHLWNKYHWKNFPHQLAVRNILGDTDSHRFSRIIDMSTKYAKFSRPLPLRRCSGLARASEGSEEKKLADVTGSLKEPCKAGGPDDVSSGHVGRAWEQGQASLSLFPSAPHKPLKRSYLRSKQLMLLYLKKSSLSSP